MNGSKTLKSVLRGQKPSKAQTPVSVQKKMKNFKNSQSFSSSRDPDAGKDAGTQEKRSGKGPPGAPAEGPGAQRKLSDASNASEDLSKDSGCLSGKLSPSDSSSEISDCPSEGGKRDGELIWVDGGAYVAPGGGAQCAKPGAERRAPQPEAAFCSPGLLMELVMGDATEDLVREVDDLRSENDYLKDEVEELRCEMLEMRDMFQEEEVYQLQELRLQLEQANKTCRILQYRLRKAERRSIRVAQTGQVDGELVRSLEHDIKVAKSVSLRLYNELEVVQKKNSQLEWENEALRERTQELEVTKQVLQAEVDKVRENTLKKKNVRSSGKTERRLSQQIEDDSADLRCQLHFAREELALMCKKLTKLVSESEAMREELGEYRSAYGDVDSARPPEGRPGNGRSREAEVKVHLKLVEEEATLLSRRIVELEVENRGLRAEMSDLRDRAGRGGGEEEEEEGERAKDAERRRDQAPEEGNGEAGPGNQPAPHATREAPVGGERTSPDAPGDRGARGPPRGPSADDYEALVALRDHSRILTSAIQLLLRPPKNGHSPPPPALRPPPEADLNGKAPKPLLPGPLGDALELLQAMLATFVGRMETLLRGGGADPPRERAEDPRAPEGGEGDKPVGREAVQGCPKLRVSLQILWVLHRWCQDKGEKQGKDRTASALRRLLQDLGAEPQEDARGFGGAPKAAREGRAEGAAEERGGRREACSSKAARLYGRCPPRDRPRRNWCYVSGEAAQLDRDDPVKTWDHLILPPSFPDLDFERMSLERSHTAPERSALRVYYSPPSARRVQSPPPPGRSPAPPGSEDATPPWCTPPTSFSQLCLGSPTNPSDDAKEAGAAPRGRGGPRMTSSATQTRAGPRTASVGLQTDAAPAARGSPSRAPGARSHLSSSLEGVQGKADRSRTSASSPKLYLRNSPYSASSPHLSSDGGSPSSCPAPRERALWSLNAQGHGGPSWARQSPGGTKPPSKGAAANRYGMVTEFLRRVSGRVEKTPTPPPPPPPAGQKAKGGLKNLERAPVRPPPAPLQRNDSVTRIVNRRFMKQREEKENNGGGRPSSSSKASEDGNYECSSSSTLAFCFARSSRSNLRPPANPTKPHRPRSSPPGAADLQACE